MDQSLRVYTCNSICISISQYKHSFRTGPTGIIGCNIYKHLVYTHCITWINLLVVAIVIMPIARKRKRGSDDPPEQVLLKFKSRSIIAAKLQSIKNSSSSNSKNAQKPTKWCNCNLSVKAFKKHKSLYFMQNKWLTTEELPESFVSAATTGNHT